MRQVMRIRKGCGVYSRWRAYLKKPSLVYCHTTTQLGTVHILQTLTASYNGTS